MANNTVDLNEIVNQFKSKWESFSCIDDVSVNQFIYGYPHQIDELHDKSLPVMVCNYPNSTSPIPEYQGNYVNTTTQFTIQIYGYTSGISRSSDISINSKWDRMEECFYFWLQNVLNSLGSKVTLGSGSVQISRRDQGSNDQLIKLEIKFNLNYYRYCFNLIQ
tara:strand:- start:3603 stop:4091 length:489 start_codon:yes stop_codon:yes gene_type:complete